MPQYAADILKATVEAKSKTTDAPLSLDTFKGTAMGAVIGAAAGALVGWRMKYSLLWCSFAGSLVGGLASRIVLDARASKES